MILNKKVLVGKLFLFLVIISVVFLLQRLDNQSLLDADDQILNVSFDTTREFFAQYNEEFSRYWKEKTGRSVRIYQSHGGSGSQARTIIDGNKADVLSLGLAFDVDSVNQNEQIINPNWQSALPNNSAPFTSIVVFMVRKGNPKDIQEWDDLANGNTIVIAPNPKTSGGARWGFLAAYGSFLVEHGYDHSKARDMIKRLYQNIPILDTGSRAATTTFVERGIGDVLITWEAEAYMAIEELGEDELEIIYPSRSILAELPVAVVDSVVDERGTRDLAEEYLKYLYSEQGQKIAAENFFRPNAQETDRGYAFSDNDIQLFTIDELFGGWEKTQKQFFSDGGLFDEIYEMEGK